MYGKGIMLALNFPIEIWLSRNGHLVNYNYLTISSKTIVNMMIFKWKFRLDEQKSPQNNKKKLVTRLPNFPDRMIRYGSFFLIYRQKKIRHFLIF